MPPTFGALGVPGQLTRVLYERGIEEPFPIQAATLPDALAGRDVCGKAPTGSGKTIAFGIPMVARITRAAPRRPKGLVLVPTRELAAQVATELSELGGRKGPSVLSIYGGVGFGPQIAALRKGVDIVVACPGRLADLINQGQLALDQVDEAAGGGHDDLGARLEGGDLRPHLGAAVDGHQPQLARLDQGAQHVGHLEGQLAGGDQHQAGRPLGGRGGDPLDQGEAEREGLARPGLGLAAHVTSGKGIGDAEALDGKGCREAGAVEHGH